MDIFTENSTAIAIGALTLASLTLIKLYLRGASNKYNPDMTGKIVIITGANTGIGYECANVIAA